MRACCYNPCETQTLPWTLKTPPAAGVGGIAKLECMGGHCSGSFYALCHESMVMRLALVLPLPPATCLFPFSLRHLDDQTASDFKSNPLAI